MRTICCSRWQQATRKWGATRAVGDNILPPAPLGYWRPARAPKPPPVPRMYPRPRKGPWVVAIVLAMGLGVGIGFTLAALTLPCPLPPPIKVKGCPWVCCPMSKYHCEDV